MENDVKTKATAVLDAMNISYKVITYNAETFVNGVTLAEHAGVEEARTYKTLLTKGKSGDYYVFVLPVAESMDMKKAAKILGEKSLRIAPVEEVFEVAGYKRGECSPLGMKKGFPTYIQSPGSESEMIYISGGRNGVIIEIEISDLKKVTGGNFIDFANQ